MQPLLLCLAVGHGDRLTREDSSLRPSGTPPASPLPSPGGVLLTLVSPPCTESLGGTKTVFTSQELHAEREPAPILLPPQVVGWVLPGPWG